MKALTKDRNQRYSSVLQFAHELTSAVQPSPAGQSPATISPTRIVLPPASAKPSNLPVSAEKPNRAKVAVLGLVLLAIIASAIWYFSRPTVQPPAHVTTPSSGATAPAGQKPRVESRPADLTPIPRRAKANPKDGLKYVWIPPGSFRMGCSPGDIHCAPNEKPPHLVTITRGFWLGQTEVTVGAYKRFAEGTGKAMPDSNLPPGAGTTPDFNSGWSNDQMPIVNVSWKDAQAYCAWAGGRLPTEAEWEYAARAGSTAARYGPLDEIAWDADNSGRQRWDSDRSFWENLTNFTARLKENGNRTHEVGRKSANRFGLFDMLGNAGEWADDWYDENYYQSSPSQDPSGPAGGQYRVVRGGSWDSIPGLVRVSSRLNVNPAFGFGDDFGVRCIRQADIP
jgi:sulfatase modifying factor 1